MENAAWVRLYNQLDSEASLLGYRPPRDLAKERHSSQCFQLEWRREPVLFFGFRDLVKIPDYSSPDHIWVGAYDPIFRAINRLIEASEDPFIPPAFGIIIDNSRGDSIIIPFNHLLAVYVDREKRRLKKVENRTFAVLNREGRYSLETSYGSGFVARFERRDRSPFPRAGIMLPGSFQASRVGSFC